MKKIFLVLFFLATAALLVSTLADNRLLHVVSKSLVMPLLILYYLASVPGKHRSIVVILAIFCSFAGDVFLLDDDFFIPGLVSFLVAHIVYIISYRHHQAEEGDQAIIGLHRIRLAFPVILAGTGLVVILYPALGALRIPVMVYAAVICVMVLVALFRYGRTSAPSFWMVFTGAVLFMISDSILAVNKFLVPITAGGFLTLVTYTAAQFLIVQGLIIHPEHDA